MRTAVIRATMAPSVHSTQPWRFVTARGSLELYADRTRRLTVLDPRGRQLLISCGCALFNARVALAAAGYDAKVERFPDPTRMALLARITLPAEADECVPIRDLDSAIEQRRTTASGRAQAYRDRSGYRGLTARDNLDGRQPVGWRLL